MNEEDKFKFWGILRQIWKKGDVDSGRPGLLTQESRRFAVTPHELRRLFYAWRVAQIEGFSKEDTDALKFKSLLEEACLKGDSKFFAKLARVIPKVVSKGYYPWRPQTALEKLRLAYLSFDPELHPTFEEVKELAIELFGELSDIDATHWRRLRGQALLSWLPRRGRGRPKKG